MLDSKVALITGASSGIGRATAIAFARVGVRVVITGRRAREGQETLTLVEEAGGEGRFVRADVTDEDAVRSAVDATVIAFGRLDFAFNNAGVEGDSKLVTDETPANFDRVFDTNVKGVMLSMKHEIPAMRQTGGGAIVNMASIVGHISSAGFSVYGASKHAVVGLSKAVALENAQMGIRVNVVSPGAVQTDMIDRIAGTDEVKSIFAALHPMGRLGKPEEIAKVVMFLCSDAASFITGQAIAIDGGYTAQ